MGAIGSATPTTESMPMEIGCASRAFDGAAVSGDQHTIWACPGGFLIAVVDGLGHGSEAAIAANLAISTVQGAADLPLDRLFEKCNSVLARTRGVVMSAVRINIDTQVMTWASIGNVDASLFRFGPNGQRRRDSIVMIGGVVGSRMPPVRLASRTLDRGDILVFATDGIRAEFGDRLARTPPSQTLADDILTHYGKTKDDALVLVARWLGNNRSFRPELHEGTANG